MNIQVSGGLGARTPITNRWAMKMLQLLFLLTHLYYISILLALLQQVGYLCTTGELMPQ